MTIQDMIRASATRQGVDPALALAVAQAESNFNPAARGSSGEVGLYQLMPYMATRLGVNAYDTQQNIDGGISLLKTELNKYQDPALAIAAYNAGDPAVDRGSIPTSTQRYVTNVSAAWQKWGGAGIPSPASTPDTPVTDVSTDTGGGFNLESVGPAGTSEAEAGITQAAPLDLIIAGGVALVALIVFARR